MILPTFVWSNGGAGRLQHLENVDGRVVEPATIKTAPVILRTHSSTRVTPRKTASMERIPKAIMTANTITGIPVPKPNSSG